MKKMRSTANEMPDRKNSLQKKEMKKKTFRKYQKKAGVPVRFLTTSERSEDILVCRNSTCRANLSPDFPFCKRCCSICNSFDDSEDPTLWLVCKPEYGYNYSCGLSCHIECALAHKRVGVVGLDGSYHCASCGNIAGILGCWKKQLTIAKEAQLVDILHSRISLGYKLLDGTSRFSELHKIVRDAKAKLEADVELMDGGTVGGLSYAGEVQKLISLAIEKADEWLAAVSNSNPKHTVGLFPEAFIIQFEEITSSSVTIVLNDLGGVSSGDDIKGYKLWYYKSKDTIRPKRHVSVIFKSQRKIFISNLQPCTEYSFEVVSYADAGDLGCSVAKCFTKSMDVNLGIDLNLAPLCDPNEELISPSEDNAGSFNASGGDLRTRVLEQASEVQAVDSYPDRLMSDGNTVVVNGQPLKTSNELASEHFLKTIVGLENKGYIKKELGLKMLAWFSMEATKHEREVVGIFIRTMLDDPCCLAEQLIDIFSDSIYSKMPREETH